MAKKTVGRKPAAARRTARAPTPKAPPILAKSPPAGPSTRSARGRKKGAQSLPDGRPVESVTPVTKVSRAAAERAFVKGLVARGEVAAAGAKLEAGMTHEVVGSKGAGTPQVTRRRFSLR